VTDAKRPLPSVPTAEKRPKRIIRISADPRKRWPRSMRRTRPYLPPNYGNVSIMGTIRMIRLRMPEEVGMGMDIRSRGIRLEVVVGDSSISGVVVEVSLAVGVGSPVELNLDGVDRGHRRRVVYLGLSADIVHTCVVGRSALFALADVSGMPRAFSRPITQVEHLPSTKPRVFTRRCPR